MSPGRLALLAALGLAGSVRSLQGVPVTNADAAVVAAAATNAPPGAADLLLKDLGVMGPDELRGELDATSKAAAAAAAGAAALRQELWRLRQQAKRTHPEVQALREQIDRLKARIEQTVDSLPEVEAKRAEEEQAAATLADLVRRQRELEKLIGLAAVPAGAIAAEAAIPAAE